MDRLLQGTDDTTGRQFVLFAKYKITTLAAGEYEVLDERDGEKRVFHDRTEALRAAGVPPEVQVDLETGPAEAAIVRVHGLISQVEAKALEAIAERQGITSEVAVRRAVAEYLLKHMR